MFGKEVRNFVLLAAAVLGLGAQQQAVAGESFVSYAPLTWVRSNFAGTVTGSTSYSWRSTSSRSGSIDYYRYEDRGSVVPFGLSTDGWAFRDTWYGYPFGMGSSIVGITVPNEDIFAHVSINDFVHFHLNSVSKDEVQLDWSFESYALDYFGSRIPGETDSVSMRLTIKGNPGESILRESPSTGKIWVDLANSDASFRVAHEHHFKYSGYCSGDGAGEWCENEGGSGEWATGKLTSITLAGYWGSDFWEKFEDARWNGTEIPANLFVTSMGAAPPPVPEPETYAMFLAGLGLLSAAARRRKTAA